MLKINQRVFCPLHETIGTVSWIGEENGEYHGDVCIKTDKGYNVWVDIEGNIPHTNVSLVEKLPFVLNERVIVRFKNKSLHFGQVIDLIPNKEGLRYKIKAENGDVLEKVPEDILSMESLLDIAVTKHKMNYNDGLTETIIEIKSYIANEEKKINYLPGNK